MIISFDASSDVQTGASIQRVEEFADERGFHINEEKPLPLMPPHPLDPSGSLDDHGHRLRKILSAEEVAERFKGRYAQILLGSKDRDGGPPVFRIVYCPLLPNRIQPHFDPAVSRRLLCYCVLSCSDPILVPSRLPHSAHHTILYGPRNKLLRC